MGKIRAVRGDITALEVDAIVNAANEMLQHGGGVAAAISRAGGPTIKEESSAWVRTNGPLRPGVAATTSGGDMPARWVIHVAGPRFTPEQDNEGLLETAVRAALGAAAAAGARSVAVPAISAGIFGYPRREATAVIARACGRWLAEHPGLLDEIHLVGYDAATANDFGQALSEGG